MKCKMAMYRDYENPYILEQRLKEVEELRSKRPYDEDLACEINELKDRINFAWQDDEAEVEGYE